jgi:hypothetical protein
LINGGNPKATDINPIITAIRISDGVVAAGNIDKENIGTLATC